MNDNLQRVTASQDEWQTQNLNGNQEQDKERSDKEWH